MGEKKNIKWIPVLMGITIIAIASFQVYWLNKAYEREQRTFEQRTNLLFRETFRSIQASKLKLDSLANDSTGNSRMIAKREGNALAGIQKLPKEKMISMMDVIMQKTHDSNNAKLIIQRGDSFQVFRNNISPRQNRLLQFLFDVDALQDTIRIAEIETAYQKKLDEQRIDVPFTIQRIAAKEDDNGPRPFDRRYDNKRQATAKEDDDKPRFNEITLGFSNPVTYRLQLGNTFPLLFRRISAAILFSIFLVGFTTLSFLLLYRNLIRQRKLAAIKNEFISNITHELKTPIATVSVAIEALRNFSANLNPQKTKEYLNISANELQRLSMLVDKVLKLSMFEKKEIELKYELLNMRQLVDEVTNSLRLQFENRKADVNIHTEGNASLEGDRLHMVSVLFNLLDNALKYSNGHPQIDVDIKDKGDKLQLAVADNGIGISPEYHNRIFEKFFRVPHGDLHNAKGYGLGLSYVSHIVEQHNGTIEVASNKNRGSKFIITLPKHRAN